MIRTGSIGLVAVWTIALTAQTPAPSVQPPSPQQPIRTTTLLVEVDTIVTDGKGQFVTGLTADDFEVLEDGKPQKIERLYSVAGTAITSTYAAVPAIVLRKPCCNFAGKLAETLGHDACCGC